MRPGLDPTARLFMLRSRFCSVGAMQAGIGDHGRRLTAAVGAVLMHASPKKMKLSSRPRTAKAETGIKDGHVPGDG
jgi:hypothetical protein